MQYKIIKNKNKIKRKIIDFENIDINSINFSNKLDFKTVKLSDIISFSMGNTPKKVDDNYNGDIPWITISNLKNKYINHYTAFVKNSKSVKIIPKDTLIGSFKMSVGRFGFTTEDCCTNEAIIAIRKEDTKENLDYLYYLLPRYFNDNAEKNGQGIPLLNSKKIKDIRVDIPKLEEQNKIVKILEKQESIILNIEKLISKTEKIFDYFESNLLSGKISLDDNKSNSWEKIKIKDSMNILYGKRITKKESSGLIPVYGGGNASFYTDSYSYENKWVIGRFALSKKCVRFINDKFWLLDSGFTFTSINNDEDFLGFKINSMQDYIYNVLARGAAQKNLDMKEFENLEIVIPPYEEQQKISKFLRKIVNLLDYQNQLLQKEKQKFEWLSEKLLSGEYLVVEDKE